MASRKNSNAKAPEKYVSISSPQASNGPLQIHQQISKEEPTSGADDNVSQITQEINRKRAKSGYLVGYEDMEPHVVKMIKDASSAGMRLDEQFQLSKVELKDFKRVLIDEMNKRMDKVRHETRGALEQLLTFIEENSKHSDGQLDLNRKLIEKFELQIQMMTE